MSNLSRDAEANEAEQRYYKATRPDGLSFSGGRRGQAARVDYLSALRTGEVVRHHGSGMRRDRPDTYLSISTRAEEALIGGEWPCRLFVVEPLGELMGASVSEHKRACLALRVVEEVETWRALGPNGERVAAMLSRLELATERELDQLMATPFKFHGTPLFEERRWAFAAVVRRAHALARERCGATWRWTTVGWVVQNVMMAVMYADVLTEGDVELLTAPWSSVMDQFDG